MTREPVDPKSELRALIRGKRASRSHSPQISRGLASGVAEVIGTPPALVASYLAMTHEPPTDLINAGFRRVLIPRTITTSAGEPSLAWIEFGPGEPTQRSSLGIDEPTGPTYGVGVEPLLTCAAVIAPSLAIDGTGRRLGQGGGYYDRILSLLPTMVPIITLLFDDEIVDDVFAQPHDISVDVCVTPTRILRFSR